MENLVKKGIWAIICVLLLCLACKFVIKPIACAVDAGNFRSEVHAYLTTVEESVTTAAFDWANTDRTVGFTSDRERNRLIDRLSNLRNGGRTHFGRYDEDSWKRLHRDILEQVIWAARYRAAKKIGIDINVVSKKDWEQELPQAFEHRYQLEELHIQIARLSWGYSDDNIPELRQEFEHLRQKLDTLMDELNIQKRNGR